MNTCGCIAAASRNPVVNKPGAFVFWVFGGLWGYPLRFALFFLPLFAGPLLAAQNQTFSSLSGTFWFDLGLNLSAQTYNPEAPGSPKEQLENLIESSQRFVQNEASYVFYGMIYGYRAVYRPPGPEQKEYFALALQAPERISAQELDIYHISRVGHRYYYSIRKRLGAFESAAAQAWRQGDRQNFQATGAAPFSPPPLVPRQAGENSGDSGGKVEQNNDKLASEATEDLRPARLIGLRKVALENAIKEGIRNYLRGKLRSRPAEVQIEVALSDVPQIFIDSGRVLATVRLYFGRYTVKNYAMR